MVERSTGRAGGTVEWWPSSSFSYDNRKISSPGHPISDTRLDGGSPVAIIDKDIG